MPFNNIELKYNSKNSFFKNTQKSQDNEDMLKTQRINNPYPYDESDNYPRRPTENYNEYRSQYPETQLPPNPSNQSPINQPTYQQPTPYYTEPNMPYQQPNRPYQPNMPYQQPTYQQPNTPLQQPNRPYQQPNRQTPYYREPDFYITPYIPQPTPLNNYGCNNAYFARDIELMHILYRDINKAIYNVVNEVLDEYSYNGSPMYEEYIDRETVAQLTDQVMERMNKNFDDVQEIMLDENNYMSEYRTEWNSQTLLEALIEAILLTEIFTVRRPNYRKLTNSVNVKKTNIK